MLYQIGITLLGLDMGIIVPIWWTMQFWWTSMEGGGRETQIGP